MSTSRHPRFNLPKHAPLAIVPGGRVCTACGVSKQLWKFASRARGATRTVCTSCVRAACSSSPKVGRDCVRLADGTIAWKERA